MSILTVDPVHPSPAALDEAVIILASGRLVVAPTETRYGLLVRADSEHALETLFDAKGRGRLQPTAIFAADLSAIENYAIVTESARLLATRFLPGPLTLVLTAKVDWPEPVVVNGKIGLRLSSSPVIAGLLKKIDFPLTATSANLSGSPDLAGVAEISVVFGEQVSLYLDAGDLRNATSTVVDCSGAEVLILREGAISAGAIREALGNSGVR